MSNFNGIMPRPDPQMETSAMSDPSSGMAASKKRKTRSGPKSRTSPYIGVSQYKRTGRWEAHIWDSTSASRDGKGKQLHLGSFTNPHQAARTYDRAAIIMRGEHAELNFPAAEYAQDPILKALRKMSKPAMVMALRRLAAVTEDDAVDESQVMEEGGSDEALVGPPSSGHTVGEHLVAPLLGRTALPAERHTNGQLPGSWAARAGHPAGSPAGYALSEEELYEPYHTAPHPGHFSAARDFLPHPLDDPRMMLYRSPWPQKPYHHMAILEGCPMSRWHSADDALHPNVEDPASLLPTSLSSPVALNITISLNDKHRLGQGRGPSPPHRWAAALQDAPSGSLRDSALGSNAFEDAAESALTPPHTSSHGGAREANAGRSPPRSDHSQPPSCVNGGSAPSYSDHTHPGGSWGGAPGSYGASPHAPGVMRAPSTAAQLRAGHGSQGVPSAPARLSLHSGNTHPSNRSPHHSGPRAYSSPMYMHQRGRPRENPASISCVTPEHWGVLSEDDAGPGSEDESFTFPLAASGPQLPARSPRRLGGSSGDASDVLCTPGDLGQNLWRGSAGQGVLPDSTPSHLHLTRPHSSQQLPSYNNVMAAESMEEVWRPAVQGLAPLKYGFQNLSQDYQTPSQGFSPPPHQTSPAQGFSTPPLTHQTSPAQGFWTALQGLATRQGPGAVAGPVPMPRPSTKHGSDVVPLRDLMGAYESQVPGRIDSDDVMLPVGCSSGAALPAQPSRSLGAPGPLPLARAGGPDADGQAPPAAPASSPPRTASPHQTHGVPSSPQFLKSAADSHANTPGLSPDKHPISQMDMRLDGTAQQAHTQPPEGAAKREDNGPMSAGTNSPVDAWSSGQGHLLQRQCSLMQLSSLLQTPPLFQPPSLLQRQPSLLQSQPSLLQHQPSLLPSSGLLRAPSWIPYLQLFGGRGTPSPPPASQPQPLTTEGLTGEPEAGVSGMVTSPALPQLVMVDASGFPADAVRPLVPALSGGLLDLHLPPEWLE